MFESVLKNRIAFWRFYSWKIGSWSSN